MNNEVTIYEQDSLYPSDIDGIEAEKEDDSIPTDGSIEDPFNPKDIKIDLKTITIDLLVKRLARNEINLFTDFQRKSDLWNKTKQSLLIESLLIRFPLPVFYFDASDDSNWLIVDGLQRVQTLKNFMIDKTLVLGNLEYLNQYNNKTFDDLPRELQRRIEETQIVTYLITEGTPESVKFNLFKRINTGGLILEPQEIRHALNQGIPAQFVKELADSDEFVAATQNSINKNRMKDRDLVNRFIAFYNVEYKNYNSDLDSFLNKEMGQLSKMSDFDRENLKKVFLKSLIVSKEVFGEFAFRKQSIYNGRGPVNKALFDIATVTLAKLNDRQLERLIVKKDLVLNDYFELLRDADFVRAISANTGGVQNVKIRFSKFEELVQKFI